MAEARTRKIAVGMSGGVDSSVAAALLVGQGCEVIGLTAHMWKEGSRCCSEEDVRRARRVCRVLGIPHYVLNASEMFREYVVDPFVAEYAEGRTPSPCVNCNKKIKFGFLLTRAVQFGCAGLATGHYARIHPENGSHRLLKARDPLRDQSYFLHRLNQRQLQHTTFPLGSMLKQDDVVTYAQSRGLPLAQREESRDLCFVPDGQYGRFVEKMRPEVPRSGPVVATDGQRLGTHAGIHNYTVGQRRGLGVFAQTPRYVVRIAASDNTVEVGSRDEALCTTCMLRNVHWTKGIAPDLSRTYKVRVRYMHQEETAVLRPHGEDSLHVEFSSPQFAVTPGQAGVIYDGDEVMGGGWIQV
ncbi:MAG: tRNA 2-thiouridine(34) synthase MnmA [Kiritimatiellia bacterium]